MYESPGLSLKECCVTHSPVFPFALKVTSVAPKGNRKEINWVHKSLGGQLIYKDDIKRPRYQKGFIALHRTIDEGKATIDSHIYRRSVRLGPIGTSIIAGQ